MTTENMGCFLKVTPYERWMTKAVSEKRHTSRSLVLASPELGRLLADRDGLTFRVKGTCMYPTIRAGDVLRIRSRAAAEFLVGDIAVCRRPKHMFSHRVIGKGSLGGRAYVITRPDCTHEGSDGPTFDEDLLGLVVAIERDGKSMPLQPVSHPWLMRHYLALRLALTKAASKALPRIERALTCMQNATFYGYIAKGWLALANPRISYTIRLPMPGLGDAVYRRLSPEAFDVRTDWRGRPVQRWTLALHLNGSFQPAAWKTFVRDEADYWHVDESFIRARYRGAGLDEALLRKADAILIRGRGMEQKRRGVKEHSAA